MWNIDPQSLFERSGSHYCSIGISKLVGNMLFAGLILTTFPAKIGDNIYIVNDKIRGNAIVQANVSITKDVPSHDLQLPFAQGEDMKVTDSSKSYSGIVAKITANFTTLFSAGSNKEKLNKNKRLIK